MVQEANHATTPDKASTVGTTDTFAEEKRKKVGNYIILKTIGEGSFAKVRMGVHLITEVKVNSIGKRREKKNLPSSSPMLAGRRESDQ